MRGDRYERKLLDRMKPWYVRRLCAECLEERRLLAADNFEDNDSFQQASDLGSSDVFFQGLSIEGVPNTQSVSDPDYFQWTPSNNGVLIVEILFEDLGQKGAGNLDLELFQGQKNLIASSLSDTDNERVEADVVANGAIFIKVFGRNGATHDDYALNILFKGRPTISSIQNQSILEDASTGLIAFAVDDVETPAGQLQLSGSSTNTTLVPNSNIVFGGDGSNRTVMVTPAANQSGATTITVKVVDAEDLTATESFVVSVNAVNDPPTISNITNQTIDEAESTGPIAFIVDDEESPAGQLQLSANSSNTTLVPNGNIVFGGSDSSRTVSVSAATGQVGSTTISITVNDEFGQAAHVEFEVTVRPMSDRDGDGLPDRWETFGVDGLNLPALGADPDRKDLFVEVDALDGFAPRGVEMPMTEIPVNLRTGTTLDGVIAAFWSAPVANPDGTTGIRLHIDLDETDIDATMYEASFRDSLPWSGFDAVKRAHFGTEDERRSEALVDAKRRVYRYGLFADTRGDAPGSSGLAEQPGNDFLITLGDWPDGQRDGTSRQGGTAQQQAGTFMHELGHTLGLDHGGGDSTNFKPNYYSVMNYHWQVPNANLGWRLDYSHSDLTTLNENRLNESAGLGFSAVDAEDVAGSQIHLWPEPLARTPLIGPVDFDRDGNADSSALRMDINGDGELGTLAGHDDWQNLNFGFRGLDNFVDGVHTCEGPDSARRACSELTFTDYTQFYDSTAIPTDRFEVNDTMDASSPLGSNDVTEPNLTLHTEGDVDWFEWIADVAGQLVVNVASRTDIGFGVNLELFDFDGTRLAGSESEPASEPIEHRVEAGQEYFVKVSSLEDRAATFSRGYYELNIDGPETSPAGTAIWSGEGDGRSWEDERNWIDGLRPGENDNVIMPRQDRSTTVRLERDETIRSVTFEGDYAVQGGTLDVATGRITVQADQRATFHSDIDASVAGELAKEGRGELELNGTAPGTIVVDGTLRGTGVILNDLRVETEALVAPGVAGDLVGPIGELVVHGEVVLDGSLLVETNHSGNGLLAVGPGPPASVTLSGTSTLVVSARGNLLGAVDEDGTVERLVLTADLGGSRFGKVRGADSSNPTSGIRNHVGFGAFIQDVVYVPVDGQARVRLFQAAPGDANGDGRFNPFDIISVLRGTRYLSGLPATWIEGDWDQNGVFDQFDLITALRENEYTTSV